MALGSAYPMNVKKWYEYILRDLIKQGYNNSMVHSDFMFGSEKIWKLLV
jgi:aminopeptidase